MNIDAIARSFLKKDKDSFLQNFQIVLQEKVFIENYAPAVEVLSYVVTGRIKASFWDFEAVREDVLPELAKMYDHSTDTYKYVNALAQEILQSMICIIEAKDVAPG